MSNSPIAPNRLTQITNDACDSALATSTLYDHAQTATWNNQIISSILKALISESSSTTSPEQTPAKYKFCVNSTIIQHLSDPRPAGTSSAGAQADEKTEVEAEHASAVEPAETTSGSKVGRRGMHSASGAYWNNEKDGMWSHKYEGGEGKGMDVVVSVMWICV